MKSLIRTASAAVFLATTVALVTPATATAAPEWDIGAYDRCMDIVKEMYGKGKIAQDSLGDAFRECCERTGGVFSPNGNDYAQCHAPPAQGRVGPSDLPTQTFTPDPVIAPPGAITQTFSPAP